MRNANRLKLNAPMSESIWPASDNSAKLLVMNPAISSAKKYSPLMINAHLSLWLSLCRCIALEKSLAQGGTAIKHAMLILAGSTVSSAVRTRQTLIGFAEHGEEHPALTIHVPRQVRRHLVGSEVDVGSLRTTNGSAGILIEHKARDGSPTGQFAGAADDRNFRAHEHERALRKQTGIRCQRALGGHRHFEAAHWARWIEAKKNVTRISIEDLTLLLRILAQVAAQPLHGHFIFAELAVLDEKPSNAPIRPAVLPCIADLQLRAVRQANGTRALNVQKKKLDWVRNPRDL